MLLFDKYFIGAIIIMLAPTYTVLGIYIYIRAGYFFIFVSFASEIHG